MTVKEQQQQRIAKLQEQWDAEMIEFEVIQQSMFNGSYPGWCVECEAWTHESIEPDVDFEPCPACGEHAVFAAEQILAYCVS